MSSESPLNGIYTLLGSSSSNSVHTKTLKMGFNDWKRIHRYVVAKETKQHTIKRMRKDTNKLITSNLEPVLPPTNCNGIRFSVPTVIHNILRKDVFFYGIIPSNYFNRV